MPVTGKIDRKYMAHYIDAGSLCGGPTSKFERLGNDLEEYNIELNPDTETSKNILGISIHVPTWGTTANFHKYSLLFYAINIIFLLFIIPSLFSLVLFILLF